MGSIWIASKMEEIHPPGLFQFEYIADHAYPKSEVIGQSFL